MSFLKYIKHLDLKLFLAGQSVDNNVLTGDWAFLDTMIVASINRVVIMNHQNLSLGNSARNCFEPP